MFILVTLYSKTVKYNWSRPAITRSVISGRVRTEVNDNGFSTLETRTSGILLVSCLTGGKLCGSLHYPLRSVFLDITIVVVFFADLSSARSYFLQFSPSGILDCHENCLTTVFQDASWLSKCTPSFRALVCIPNHCRDSYIWILNLW